MAMTAPPGGPKRRPRSFAIVSRCAIAAACALLVAACGSTAAPGSGAASSGTASHGTASHGTASQGTASTASAAKVSLNVTFVSAGPAGARHWTLRCDPTGGSYPRAATACAELAKSAGIFSPPPVHAMCPMIMASAQRVIVSGVYHGKKLRETIVDGGCDLTRWAKLRQIFN